MPSPHSIERYHGRDIPSPRVPAIGHSAQSAARPGLHPHTHSVFEVCIIDRGAVDWFADDQDHHIPPHSLFITPPGQEHGSRHGVVQPCHLRWLQLDARGTAETRTFARAMRNRSQPVSPSNPKLVETHEAMLDECRHPRPDGTTVFASLLTLFIGLILRSLREGSTAGHPPAVDRAIDLITRDPAQRWKLTELAEAVGVSRASLQQRFVEHTGISPIAYATRLRLRHAQSLLRDTDRPVTEIAHHLSFASSQHFATAFRQHFGITPTQCRRAVEM